MTANAQIERGTISKAPHGYTMMQLLITVAVVAVVSALAIYGIASARQRIRLTNSSRLLASYVEKARVDSVRRHPMASADMAGIEILDRTRYRVRMDFDSNGTVETKVITLDSGVVFATDPIALAFDWRGRLVDLPLTDIKVSIAMQWGNDPRDQRVVDVTRSGDVTIDSDVYLDDVPNVNVNVNALTGIDSGSTLNANNQPAPSPSPTAAPTPQASPTESASPPVADASPSPIADPSPYATPAATPDATPYATPSATPGANPSPSPAATATPCTVVVTTNPSPLVISKHGTGTIAFTVNPSGTVNLATDATNPSNLGVTRTSGNTFTVQSLNNTRGNFTLTFTTPCGAQKVGLSVVN